VLNYNSTADFDLSNFDNGPINQALEGIQTLLQLTVSQVGEMYESRPVMHTASDVKPFSGEPNDFNWTDWEVKFSKVAIIARAQSCTFFFRRTCAVQHWSISIELPAFDKYCDHAIELLTYSIFAAKDSRQHVTLKFKASLNCSGSSTRDRRGSVSIDPPPR